MIKKKISKVAIAMIIIVVTLLLGTFNIVNAAGTTGLPNRYYVCLKEGFNAHLVEGAEVQLHELSGDVAKSGGYISALYFPHVYCAEHGTQVKGRVTYTVCGEYTVQDPVLAYILAHGPSDISVLEDNYHTEPSQVALWHYLSTENTDDKIIIADNLTQKDKHHNGNVLDCCRLFKNKNQLYLDAEDYAKNLNTKPTLTLSLSGNTLNYTVGGYFTEYDLIVNEELYLTKTDKDLTRNDTGSIDITQYSTSEISVQVKAKKPSYTVKYFVLKNAKNVNQRMLVVTSVEDGVQTVEGEVKTVKINTNVSLQKYITHVNNTPVASRANRKAVSTTTNAIASTIPNSTGTNKRDDVVEIEAGDNVTYRIALYNNSSITVEEINVTDKLPEGATLYSINNGTYQSVPEGREFTYTPPVKLNGGESTFFEVTVYFGEYKNKILDNKAAITGTTPNNNTIYRTEDHDYVKMKEYKVSLEKYIAAVNSNYNGDPENDEIIKTYTDIINYLKEHNVSIDTLISQWSGKTLTFDKKYDINNDGKINDIDYNIFNKYKNITKKDIEEYISADLNEDGRVDDVDLEIYKVIKSNLYSEDISLNNYDRYIFILKYMYEKGTTNETNVLNYLYTQRLLEETGKSKEQLSEDITNYLKSDVNNDGYVDYEDNYVLEDEFTVNIKGEEYNLYFTDDPNSNFEDGDLGIFLPIEYQYRYEKLNDESEIENLENDIDRYDYNEDGTLNIEDITFFEEYNEGNKYYLLSRQEYQDVIRLEDEFYKWIRKDRTVDNSIYDFTVDSYVYFDDYISIQEAYEKEINPELKEDLLNFSQATHELLSIHYGDSNYKAELDFNEDDVIDYEDYEILTAYINFIKYAHNHIQDQNRVEILKEEIINQTTIRINNNKYDSAYDINRDNKIDFTDYIEARTKGESIELIDDINNVLTIWESNDFDFNIDGKVDYLDYEFLTKYYIEDINSININISRIEDIIDYSSIFDKNVNQSDVTNDNVDVKDKDFSQEDINVIRVRLGWREFDEKYYSENFTLYDINQDGVINNEDSELINIDYSALADIPGSVLINEDTIEDIIKVLKNEYSNIGELELDEVADEYAKLDEIISSNIKNVEEILSNQSYTNKVSDLKNAYNFVESKTQVDIKLLDINDDGLITNSDLGNFGGYNISVDSFDKKQIITNNDINKDGKVDQNDVTFYNNLKTINQDIKDVIKSAMSGLSNSTTETDFEKERQGKAEYLTKDTYQDNTASDNSWTQHNTWKYDNLVDGINKGDIITYKITVRNDGETYVYITEISDYWKYVGESNVIGSTVRYDVANKLLAPGESASFTMQATVEESNMSLNVIQNTAEITGMKNKNNITVDDTTPNNNKDSDYFQMKDIVISGNVWNDKALNKLQDNYNGRYDIGQEEVLPNIKVYLYRGQQKVAETQTDGNGNYLFTAYEGAKAGTGIGVIDYEKDGIKGPKVSGTKRWSGTYYSYYIKFEYDGIKYTSTFTYQKDNDGKITNNIEKQIWNITENDLKNNVMYSNAKENDFNRLSFNNRFSTINSSSNIKYDTVNKSEYIPQSIHKYGSNMLMTSSSNLITVADSEELEAQLKHVNLGLRGKDIFDLELTSDVDSIKVTVNNVKGVYKYTNSVELRRSDITVAEDAANLTQEQRIGEKASINQNIRTSDLDVNKGISNIEVIYKITVQNTSPTAGIATKVTNYYDRNYTFKGAYPTISDADNNTNKLGLDDALSENLNLNEKYGYKTIVTPGTKLNKNEKMEIYVVYTATNDLLNSLKGLQNQEVLPTFNMSEIAEYKTALGTGQTQYTRGLIDKDSAPGSANREQVRLTSTEGSNTSTTNGNPTTVEYYFNKKLDANKDNVDYLGNLKYEDDTYATPTLCFVADGSTRMITGTVFEDKTTTDSVTRIKTGNGILDEGEVPVYGAKVQLIEQVGEGILIDEQTTDIDGTFTFTGFLPGNYIIKYYYGNTEESVLLNKAQEGINSKSYNGEDFQATNNIGTHGASKLNETEKYWYVYNESDGISAAIDNTTRRIEVSNRVTAFIDEEMTVLNNMRNGKTANDSKITYKDNDGAEKTITVENIMDSTYMFSETNNMSFGVEEIVDINKLDNKNELLSSNKITITMKDDSNRILLGEWTSFPNENDNYYKEYKIENMNFGIAEVPVTTVNLQKDVKSFTLTDSTGNNIIARATKNSEGKWDNSYTKGNTKTADGWRKITVEVEDDKLQGAKLEVTYTVSVDMNTEINFDGTENIVPTITGVVDFVNNNLSYNEALGDNARYWEVTTYDYIAQEFANQVQWDGITNPEGTVDPDGTAYTTILKAKVDNPLLLTTVGTGTATITLEKVLSSSDATILDMIVGTDDSDEYYNIVEIIGFDYRNTTINTEGDEAGENEEGDNIMRDRIRTADRYIIIPGVQYDSATSETISIIPPTGDSSVSTIYLILAIISLVVLAAGAFGIKKFVLKK